MGVGVASSCQTILKHAEHETRSIQNAKIRVNVTSSPTSIYVQVVVVFALKTTRQPAIKRHRCSAAFYVVCICRVHIDQITNAPLLSLFSSPVLSPPCACSRPWLAGTEGILRPGLPAAWCRRHRCKQKRFHRWHGNESGSESKVKIELCTVPHTDESPQVRTIEYITVDDVSVCNLVCSRIFFRL